MDMKPQLPNSFSLSKVHRWFSRINTCTRYKDKTVMLVVPCFPKSQSCPCTFGIFSYSLLIANMLNNAQLSVTMT